MSHPIRLAISTCPNDTFAFHALMNHLVDWRGLDFEIELLDIQQLNDGLFAGRFDVAKTSFHAAILLADKVVILRCGSALGFGVGPLLLSSRPDITPTDKSQVTLCPGEQTTASLLFRLFYPNVTSVEQVVFSEIMPMLKNREADFGVCIHEGRFTWQSHGLGLIEDLGVRWENETKSPLPLGGLVARASLPRDLIETIESVIHDSIQFALAHPDSALESMRRYALEFDDSVLMKHVELYVNDWTLDLGAVGKSAIQTLTEKAHAAGIG